MTRSTYRRRVSFTALAVGLTLTVAACGGSPDADEEGEGPISIGSVHPMSGALALEGRQMDQAVQMAVEEINENGGIEALGGRQLKVVSADSQGKPDVGQTAAQQLIERDEVAALIGAYQSAVSLNVSNVAERYQVPFVMDIAADDAILGGEQSFTYRLQPNATVMGRDGARNLAAVSEQMGDPIKTVAYLHDNTSFGEGIFDAFAEEAEALGIDVVIENAYDPATTEDFTTQMARISAASPDALVATGYYADGIKIAQAALAVMPDLKTVFGVGQAAFANAKFTNDAAQASELVLCSCYHENATSDRVQEIKAAYEEQYGEAMISEALFAYQATLIVAQAMEESGSADPVDIRDAIAEMEFADHLLAYTEPISFDDDGENAAAAPAVTQVQDGALLQVYPETLAEAEPRYPGTAWAGSER